MNLEKLLEIIQVQRHDFLNHLQVISGFLQLNKPERIREYIELVTADMSVMSQTARLKIPEITAALLVGFNEAAKYQAEMELAINSNLDQCTVPGPVAGGALGSVIEVFLRNLSSSESYARNFTVRLAENGTGHTICLRSPAFCIADPVLLKKDLEPVKELLNKYAGELKTAFSSEILEIFLDFPGKRAENGQTIG
ncbi:Spo0B domain-containing protein [Pelotomaculum propionicicum]|uniref:Spo0B domain-containing protein n=1 Tax=Pelotomaculum propionicicum TaxID=258475 RepID=UPI003B7F4172